MTKTSKNGAIILDASAKLRRNYLDILRRRVRELRNFAGRCLEGQLALAEIEDMHLRVRSLVGSGTTYGYADISAAAYPLDHALDSPTTVGLRALAGLALDLAAACGDAVDRDTAPAKGPRIAESPKTDPMMPRPVLLVIDDDPAIHDLIGAMFGDSAHVVSTYNGDEALDAMHRHCPNLILLDNYIPGTDGLKLLEAMSDDRSLPPVPVIMLTADARPREIMRASAAGAADYITKPFEPTALAEKIIGMLARARMTVLVANGSPVMRELISGKLRRMGLNVVEAGDGDETVKLAEKFIPELILLDQSLPGMSGGDALRALRSNKRTRHIPTLYLTLDSSGQGVLEGLNLGINGPTVTPFVPERVTARIMDALGLETQWS